jgi:hypothetical protein
VVLNHPPPTIIEFGNPSVDSSEYGGNNVTKVAGISRYLSRDNHIGDNDIALVVDNDVWFQLPPQLMLERSHVMLKQSNDRLRERYVAIIAKMIKPEETQRFRRNIARGLLLVQASFAALVNDTILRASQYRTQQWPLVFSALGRMSRPRWLNSGTVIGVVEDIKLLSRRAVDVTEESHMITK